MRSGADLNGDNLRSLRAYLRISEFSDHCRVTVTVRVRDRVRVRLRIVVYKLLEK